MMRGTMKQFALTFVAAFAAMLLFFLALPFVLIGMVAASAGSSTPSVPSVAVIELDLRQGLTDQPDPSPFSVFGGGGLALIEVVQTLDRAAEDNRVKGLFVRLPEGGMTPAVADELRQAFRRFRASAKPIIIHSQGLMPSGAVISTYMLGASGSEFWMQENASFQATGLAREELFFGRAFQRYGVRADFEQRYEYKNAPNSFIQSDFTEAHREATVSWMTSVYETAIASAAQDRRQEPAVLRAAIEGGPYGAAEARAAGLIDRTGQVTDAEAEILRRAGNNAQMIRYSDYVARERRRDSGRHTIAIVGGEGAIMTGRGSSDPFASGSTIYSDTLAQAIRDATRDSAVRAIVFRVSSPGGSDVASEQILAAVREAKAAGKPVVVSMGAYAASGGYWVSSEASAIVAQPTTLTGSIGVFGGKFVLGDALSRFGLDMRSVSVGGDYADAFDTSRPFDQAERAAFSAWMDQVYETFVTRVSAGRNLPAARVREIARGRVWTGAQARELGLVDELGGLYEAIARARVLAEIPEGDSVRYRYFPRQRSPFEAFGALFGGSSETAETLMALNTFFSDPTVRAALSEARTARLRSQGAVVLADEPLNP